MEMRAENEKAGYWKKVWKDTYFNFSTNGFPSDKKFNILY